MEPVRYTTVQLEPLGRFYVGYTGQGVCFLSAEPQSDAAFAGLVRRRYRCDALRDDAARAAYQDALERWLAGEEAPVPLDLSRLTPFARAVSEEARRIPRGEVRSYGWLARAVGSPGGSRAVGNVMARNPIPLLIPCHRVVPASGGLGNYSMGGPGVKRRLLELEGVDLVGLEAPGLRG